MSKKEKTGQVERKEATEYSPVYLTVNASNNPALVGYTIEKSFAEAAEYKLLLYLTINSGNPPPPICPPGFDCNKK